VHSAFVEHPRNGSLLQCPSDGPTWHWPIPVCCPALCRHSGTQLPPGQFASLLQVRLLFAPPSQASEQPLGFVARPGRAHEPAAGGEQSLSLEHNAPRLLEPVPHRKPPHTPPVPHCASFLHGAPGVGPPPQVSQGH
jgi:hypothetical protein